MWCLLGARATFGWAQTKQLYVFSAVVVGESYGRHGDLRCGACWERVRLWVGANQAAGLQLYVFIHCVANRDMGMGRWRSRCTRFSFNTT